MDMPGFNAEASLYKSTGLYSMALQTADGTGEAVFPAALFPAPSPLSGWIFVQCHLLAVMCILASIIVGDNNYFCRKLIEQCSTHPPSRRKCPDGRDFCGEECCASTEICLDGSCVPNPCPPDSQWCPLGSNFNCCKAPLGKCCPDAGCFPEDYTCCGPHAVCGPRAHCVPISTPPYWSCERDR